MAANTSVFVLHRIQKDAIRGSLIIVVQHSPSCSSSTLLLHAELVHPLPSIYSACQFITLVQGLPSHHWHPLRSCINDTSVRKPNTTLDACIPFASHTIMCYPRLAAKGNHNLCWPLKSLIPRFHCCIKYEFGLALRISLHSHVLSPQPSSRISILSGSNKPTAAHLSH